MDTETLHIDDDDDPVQIRTRSARDYRKPGMLACLCIGSAVFMAVGVGVGASITSASQQHRSAPVSWLEGTTWVFHVSTNNVSSAAEMTVVRGDDTQMIATSSAWVALRHAFDDHIPFLGRIQRAGLTYYENGDAQTLFPQEDTWSTTCFDIPFVMHRSGANEVRGTSVARDVSMTAVVNEQDGFIDQLVLSGGQRLSVDMRRLHTSNIPFAPGHAFWFARSTNIAAMQRCAPSSILIPDRLRKRTLVAMRTRMPGTAPVRPLVLTVDGLNRTLHTDGIVWFPRRALQTGTDSDPYIHVVTCDPSSAVDILLLDMYKWPHALAKPEISMSW